MVRPGRHNLVQIGPEDQPLAASLAFDVDGDGDERRVLDRYPAALGRVTSQ